MEIYTKIKQNTYQDSIKMMQFQAALKQIQGVIDCGVAMATPTNKSQFREAGLLTEEAQHAKPNDLCIVVKAESGEAIAIAVDGIEKYFKPKELPEQYLDETAIRPKSISSALKRLQNANLAIISVPGEYAAFEAVKALNSGLNVFLFSDNVPLEDEIELKVLAEQKDLLMMGPDCGTAVISGIGLGFSNVIRGGMIGIVGASGSGMQEVCCLINRMGEGISQAIGTGGRDLSAEVGGRTFIRAMDALMRDDETDVIVLMSKHCDEEVAKRMVEKVKISKKPVIVYFPGSDSFLENNLRNIYKAENLEHVAASSVKILQGEIQPSPVTKEFLYDEMAGIIERESSRFSQKQEYVRALLTGGSFVDQAITILPTFFPRVYTYPFYGQTLRLENPQKSIEHTIVDLGEDYFTKGKVHPIIDPSPRNERILKEADDDKLKVILLDVILGYSAHSDPAGNLAKVISDAKVKAEGNGCYLSVIINICGTDKDPQNLKEQKDKLEYAGAIVTESSTRATFLAGLIGLQ